MSRMAGTHTTRAIAAVGVLITAGAALGGCAASGVDLPSDAPIATSDWDARDGGMTALLEGELALEDGCVYVTARDIGRVLPVFPRDRVGWDPETETLSYGGNEFAMGDIIAAGGGWVSAPDSASIPAACEPDEWGDVMLIQDESIDPMSHRGD